MKDTRLTPEELDRYVFAAYGGAAYREGRRAQARAVGNLLRGRPLDEVPGASDKARRNS